MRLDGKVALITGATGQDGAYLSQFLLQKGYRVVGLLSRRMTETLWRLRELGVEDRVEIIDKKVEDHGVLAITNIYVRYLLPMMIEVQWWDMKFERGEGTA